MRVPETASRRYNYHVNKMNLIFTVQWVPVGQLVELGSDTTVPGLSTQTNNLMYWKSVWVKMPAE